MAINDKDFYASHELDFDYKNMLDEYIKGVIKQAKIEVLTELQKEIKKIEVAKENTEIRAGECCMKGACIDLIRQKIDALREVIEDDAGKD